MMIVINVDHEPEEGDMDHSTRAVMRFWKIVVKKANPTKRTKKLVTVRETIDRSRHLNYSGIDCHLPIVG